MSVAQDRLLPDNKKTIKPRSNKINFLEKLHLLQIHGSFKDPKRRQTHKLFDKFPRRLVFSLSQLIEGDDWKSELTFLGFTRDGQFMLSYSCHYSLGGNHLRNTYTYVYYMQWWQFVPYRPLKKIRETRLFGDQEIMDDLALTICQWPTDDTKLLVYGSPNNVYSMRLDPDVVRCYYITVVAIPPLQPCSDCSAIRVPDTEMSDELQESDSTDSEDDFQSLNNHKYCLQHSFVIHTRYILVPPYPAFNPFICMKINGLVIINTGDNLIVLSVGMLKSNRPFVSEERLSVPNFQVAGQQSNLPYTSVYEELVGALDINDACSCCSSNEKNQPKGWFHRDFHSKDTTKQVALETKLDTEICNECGKEIVVKWRSRIAVVESSDETCEDFTPLVKRSKLSEECFKDVVITQDCTFKEETKSVDEKIAGEIKCLTIQLDNGWKETECSEIALEEKELVKKTPTLLIQTTQLVTHNFTKHFEKENISPKLGRIIGVVPRLLSPKEKKLEVKMTEDITDTNEAALDVPSFGGALNHPSSASVVDHERGSSTAGDPQTHRNSGSCVSGISQYFVDWMEHSPSSSPSQFEDDSAGTEYHNVLSFEVHGSQYKLLKQISVEKLHNWGGSAISVGQLNFDIEQFAHEMAAEICKKARKKYLAFLDYDVQIIDLCEISMNVIALVIMQVQAMAGQKGVAKELRSSVRKVFQTGFKFEWHVESGNYNVIDTDELVEAGFLRENGPVWNPARLKVMSLRKEFCVPQSLAKTVRVMSNANLPHGESLKVLFAPPGQDFAIVH